MSFSHSQPLRNLVKTLKSVQVCELMIDYFGTVLVGLEDVAARWAPGRARDGSGASTRVWLAVPGTRLFAHPPASLSTLLNWWWPALAFYLVSVIVMECLKLGVRALLPFASPQLQPKQSPALTASTTAALAMNEWPKYSTTRRN